MGADVESEPVMSELLETLSESVRVQSRTDKVALLLSGGIDSMSTGIALQNAGKTVKAYTFEIQGYRSKERRRVEAIARHFGWELCVIAIPTASIRSDFLRLAIKHGCRKKVHFEVTFPLLYVLPHIAEIEVWTGWNADDNYGNTRKVALAQAKMARNGVSAVELKEAFDVSRRERRTAFNAPSSSDTWWIAKRLTEGFGKRLLDPYDSDTVRDYFVQFDHAQLSSPKKPLIRAALEGQLRGLPPSAVGPRIPMQKGGRVDLLFRTLLTDPGINRFERRYETVSALCLRWGQEVAGDPERFASELSGLPARPVAAARIASDDYQPYRMADVQHASAFAKFTVVSMFSGGGGSSLGYKLAGGAVLLASEFVPEAARTYLANFPECKVDRRNIRDVTNTTDGVMEFLEQAGLAPGQIDILDGSPPCSEFSVAGRGPRDQNALRRYSDVKQANIATLPFDFVDVAGQAMPKIVICENVPALATGQPELLQRILQALRFGNENGRRTYYAASSVITASDFGVPQNRRRLFIMGIRRDVAEVVGIGSDDDVLSLFPIPTHSMTSIRAALDKLPQSESDFWPWRKSVVGTPLDTFIKMLPKNPPKPTRLSDISSGNTGRFTLTRTSWDVPSPTLVVTGQKPDGMTGAIHPEYDRKFTIPELKRLFGLPDDFVLTGTLSQAAERICRMVPPFMTKAIAESIYRKVLLPFAEKNT